MWLLAFDTANRDRLRMLLDYLMMRRVWRILPALLLVLLLCGAGTASAAHGPHGPSHPARAGARITDVSRADGRMLDVMVHSPAMGDSIPVRFILPRSWPTVPRGGFPVVYMLHGGNDDYTSWTRETDVEELAEREDVLIVMPDGGKAGYYSDWLAGAPRWETFHTVELVELVERTFHASSARAVIGLSMGGFGALNYAARHPGMFRYAASMSSYVDLDNPVVRVALALGSEQDGVDLRDVWGDPVLDADVWRAHNPAAMPEAFRGTKVHLSAGDGKLELAEAGRPVDVLMASMAGEAVLHKSVADFARALRAAGVETTTHFYSPGTHSWPYWERELHAIWPAVMRELA